MHTLTLLALLVPTPSVTLSPLPTGQVNYYASRGAAASGLDPALVRAVIDAESVGDPHAVSKAGAIGLMQLEGGVATDCKLTDRYDPLLNAVCGSQSLAYLVHALGFQGGIAAYNWGSGNVRSHPHEKDWPNETRAYVANVINEYDALQHAGPLEVDEPPPAFVADGLACPLDPPRADDDTAIASLLAYGFQKPETSATVSLTTVPELSAMR